MNITEANAVNKVLQQLLGTTGPLGQEPDPEDVRKAAVYLADRANIALGAGLTGTAVNLAWTPEVCR